MFDGSMGLWKYLFDFVSLSCLEFVIMLLEDFTLLTMLFIAVIFEILPLYYYSYVIYVFNATIP